MVTSSEKKFLETYLLTIPYWTFFDVNIFGMCLEILDEEEVYDLGQDMLASHELTQIIAFNSEIVKKTGINLYVYLIAKGWYRRAENIEKELSKLLTEWDMEEKISIHIFKKFAQYKKEKSPDLLKAVQDDIQSLKNLGAVGIANRFAMETGALDDDTGREIIDILMSLVGDETTLIIATHDPCVFSRVDSVLNLS